MQEWRNGMPRKIVSGGQTGVDRAALDVAIEVGLECGGWCPRGRRAEDGPIPAAYPLTPTPCRDHAQRTRWNVRDSDATLLLLLGPAAGGTALALAEAKRRGKPLLAIDLAAPGGSAATAAEFHAWVGRLQIRTLNVAGPRESEQPGIHALAAGLLRRLMAPPAENP